MLQTVDGHPVVDTEDYDSVAARFERGEEALFVVERGGRALSLEVRPGRDAEWGQRALVGLLVAMCLVVVWLLTRRWSDLRARLLGWLLLLAAAELALPWDTVGFVGLAVFAEVVYRFLAAGQIAVAIHLAGMLPSRAAWLRARPWIVPALYASALALATTSGAVFLWEVVADRGRFPWPSLHPDRLLFDIGLPLGAVVAVSILARTAWRFGEHRGRVQAGLILLGLLPWTLQILWSTAMEVSAAVPVVDTTPLFLVGVLIFAFSVIVAVYRYGLFDIELVVRRGLALTVASALLMVLAYAGLALLGLAASRRVALGAPAVWATVVVAFGSGLLFEPLRRGVERWLDRGIFHERHALRRRLIDLTRALPTLGTLPRMSRHLTSKVRETFDARTTALFLTDPASGLLTTLISKPGVQQKTSELPLFLSPEDPAIERLRRDERPRTVAELGPMGAAMADRLRSLHTELLVPLVHHQQLVGILALGPRLRDRYGAEEKELLLLLARHAATVFENVRLFQSATYEPLTGLLRREAVLESLAREAERAQRYRRPLTVAMADIDHFKDVNDAHGHLAGDRVLQRVAAELITGLRATDTVGRYGGEEFLIVWPETRIEDAAKVAEDIRHRVSTLRTRLDDGAVVRVRISIGLHSNATLSPDDPEPATRLVEGADRALFHAKEAGRDRVETAGIDPETIATVRAARAARRRVDRDHRRRTST